MNLQDLRLRLRAIIAPNQVERELDEELSFHIEREALKLIEQGVPADEARMKARARFGSATVIADECRDERGTAFIDNTIGDVQFALRTFKRSPLTAITIVGTVAIGLGIVAALYTLLNTFLFRVDQVPDVKQMYAVEDPLLADGAPQPWTRPRFEALRAETSVFTDAFAELSGVDLRVDGRTMAVTLVTGNFFDVVGVQPVMGRPFGAADDERSGGQPVIVLSDRGWDRHFKRDPNVLGRMVLVNGAPFAVIGVMPAGFRGLAVGAPDFWSPLSQVGRFQPDDAGREDAVAVTIVGRLKPELSVDSARAQMAAWYSNLPNAENDRRVRSIALVPHRGTVPQPLEAVAVFTPLFFAFGLILLIGCANVANLLLARGVARQREIGVRLSLGASRRRIVRQLLTESVMLALAAAAGGYVISRSVLEGAVYWTMKTIPMDLGDVNLGVPAADWRVALFLVIAAVGATALFALMPALQATRIEPVRTLRGELLREARPGRARNVLIGVQVFASALLLICAAVFLRSTIASAQYDPGLRTADTVIIDLGNEPNRAALVQAIAVESTIDRYAAVKPMLLAAPPRAFADAGDGKVPVTYKFVSDAYFDVLGIPIVRGRGFAAFERNTHPVAIVSESVAQMLWPNGSGIGETFRLEPEGKGEANAFLTVNPEAAEYDKLQMPPRVVTVVGVVKDVPGFRITDVKEGGVFLPTGVEVEGTTLMARVKGEPAVARQTLLDHLTRVDPNVGQVITMRTVARLETFFLQIAFWISFILGGLALLLTVSGLFSVLSYLVEQRKKEIGVRMALGASTQKVTRLVLSQTARPVIYGMAAGAALAATLAGVVLAAPFGGVISQIVHVTDPVAYVSSLLVIVAACLIAAWIPAMRASKLDPMRTLRQD